MMVSKKIIDIFNFKQRLLSIDMKTKVVQHVPRIIIVNVFKVFKFSGCQVVKFDLWDKSRCLELKMSMLFWDILLILTLPCEFANHRAGSQLKTKFNDTAVKGELTAL